MRLLAALFLFAAAAFAADPAGQWTASIDTQIGTQNYTYTFQVTGNKLTGTAENGGKKYELRNGRYHEGKLTFLELFVYMDQEIPIEYTGTLAGDEIKFTRKVGEYAVEDFVAKKAKSQALK